MRQVRPSSETEAPLLSRVRRAGLLVLLVVAATVAQTLPGTPALKIGGAVSNPLSLTVGDLKGMPRKILQVTNAHEKKEETYEGVSLELLLQKAGAPNGSSFVDR